MPMPFRPREIHTNADLYQTMRALLATHESTRRQSPATENLDAYTEGFQTAIRLLAEALNVRIEVNR